jgi:hypothetical protein
MISHDAATYLVTGLGGRPSFAGYRYCNALRGDERHDRDGGYVASGPGPRTDRRLFVKRAEEMRRLGHEVVVANGQARTGDRPHYGRIAGARAGCRLQCRAPGPT